MDMLLGYNEIIGALTGYWSASWKPLHHHISTPVSLVYDDQCLQRMTSS